MQGIRLQRTTTLVEGADRCDFRLIPASQVTKGVKGNGSGKERQDQEIERFRTGGVFSAEKHEQVIGTEDLIVHRASKAVRP